MTGDRSFPSKLVTGTVELARRGGRSVRRVGSPKQRRRLAGKLRDFANRLNGVAYRIEGGGPDPQVSDQVLVQRVRSRLGPLEKRLDVPRLHVTAVDGVVTLRGTVGRLTHAARLITAASKVRGVAEVRSKIRVGFSAGDTRPSEGRAQTSPSDAWRQLVGAVRAVGVEQERPTGVEDQTTAERLTTAILAAFLRTLPDGERAHTISHLPVDIRQRVTSAAFVGQPRRPRTVEEFLDLVTASCSVRRDIAELASRELLDVLKALVPEEEHDIEAVLPTELKTLWR
ncbi:MAG: DUF2267 domain-containing protein, partial [Nitriliruptorales bacterium]|nr:DUF2267 domain-containing protein [Nitriliruptorales bacterium]